MALLAATLLVVVGPPERASAYIPRAHILIDGNSGFTAANGVTGGAGTPSDPYLIEGWQIDTSTAAGIEIRNTSVHFIVRGVYVHDVPRWQNDGIVFYNVANGTVENSTVSR